MFETETIIIIVVAVGIAYLFFGKKALFGLLALVPLLLKGKGVTTGEKVSKLDGKIEDSQQRQDRAEAESIKATQEASESNKKAVKAAEDITVPDYDLSGGFTKHTSSSE